MISVDQVSKEETIGRKFQGEMTGVRNYGIIDMLWEITRIQKLINIKSYNFNIIKHFVAFIANIGF